MKEEVAEEVINSVLEFRENGINDHELIIEKLNKKFSNSNYDFRWALEMISTGAFRATIMCSGKRYPTSNISIEDDPVLKLSFKKCWIELKGEDHYEKYYLEKRKKWWDFLLSNK